MKIWSNISFVIPFVMALYFGLYIYASIVLISTFLSTMYHLHNEKRFKKSDMLLSTLLITCNLYYFYLSGFKEPYFASALLFVLIGFWFFYKATNNNYALNHSVWHVASACITVFAIVAFVV